MKIYKVLTVKDNKVYSPFQKYYYGELSKIENRIDICKDFDVTEKKCSNGFYAVMPEGLIYCINKDKDNRVFEVEMSGKNIKFNENKHRFEKQKIIRMLSKEKTKSIIKDRTKNLDWDLYKAIYPTDPRKVDNPDITEEVIELLKEWDSVRDSVRNSVRNSVWDSVWGSVWDSVWDSVGYSIWYSIGDSVWYSVGDSVGDSVWDSVVAYIGSCFPNIKEWKYIEHKSGEYPFKSAIKLHELGFVPSFDGNYWRLHSGKNMNAVYKISRNELLKMD